MTIPMQRIRGDKKFLMNIGYTSKVFVIFSQMILAFLKMYDPGMVNGASQKMNLVIRAIGRTRFMFEKRGVWSETS
jgi:hypothetical protein